MRILSLVALLCSFILPGCTTIQRTAHMYGTDAPQPLTFHYKDGGTSIYYSFPLRDPSAPDTVIFFFGGTGCPSWKSVMPSYINGLSVEARILALNKRFVPDRSTGIFGRGDDFHVANNPAQWVADYSEFIAAQLSFMTPTPRNVVLVGVSEGAIPAVKLAASLPAITHLAIMGSGGYSMRKSLDTLKQRGAISPDIGSGWKKIAADPRSIEKNWYGNRYRWWSDVMDIDPLPDFLKLNIPVLVGIGENDESVPVESARFLETIFTKEGKRNLTVKVYPGADHRLNANSIAYRSEFFAELGGLLK